MKSGIGEWFVIIIFTIVGAISTIVSLKTFSNPTPYIYMDKGVAKITNIEAYRSGDNLEFNVYIQYTVDNKTYNQNLNYWEEDMKFNKEITIYYNPDNPIEIKVSEPDYIILVATLVGVLIFVVGITLITRKIKAKNIKFKLLKNGNYINAEIEEIIYNTSYSINGISPYIITCKWKNPSNGNTYLFKSDNIWYDPEPFLNEENVTELPVYLNINNPKKYYISLKKIENKVLDLK